MPITADGVMVDVCAQPTGIQSIGCGLNGNLSTTLVIQYTDCRIETFPNDARCKPRLKKKGCGLNGKPKTSYVEIYDGDVIKESPLDPVCSKVKTGMECQSGDLIYTCGGKKNKQTDSPICVGKVSLAKCQGEDFVIQTTTGSQIKLPKFTDCVKSDIVDSGCGLTKGGAIAQKGDFVTVRSNGLLTIEKDSVKCRDTILFQGCGVVGLTPSPGSSSGGNNTGFGGGGLANSDGTLTGEKSIWDTIGSGNPLNDSGRPPTPGDGSGGNGTGLPLPDGLTAEIAEKVKNTPVSTYLVIKSDNSAQYWAYDRRCAQNRACGNSSSLAANPEGPQNLPSSTLVVTWKDGSWSTFGGSWRCIGAGNNNGGGSPLPPVPPPVPNDPPPPDPLSDPPPPASSGGGNGDQYGASRGINTRGFGAFVGDGGFGSSKTGGTEGSGGAPPSPPPPPPEPKPCGEAKSEAVAKYAENAAKQRIKNTSKLLELQAAGWIISSLTPYEKCLASTEGGGALDLSSDCPPDGSEDLYPWEVGNDIILVNDAISGGVTQSISMTFLDTATVLRPTCDGIGNRRPRSLTLEAEIIENDPASSVVGKFTVGDPDFGDTYTISLVSGTEDFDNSKFTIAADLLIFNEVANYESRSSYGIRASVTDGGGLSIERYFTVPVKDINEPPTDIRLSKTSVPDASPIGTTVGILSLVDPETTGGYYELTMGPEWFTVDEASRALKTAVLIDKEVKPLYQIRIKGCDNKAGDEDKPPLCLEKDFTIYVGQPT